MGFPKMKKRYKEVDKPKSMIQDPTVSDELFEMFISKYFKYKNNEEYFITAFPVYYYDDTPMLYCVITVGDEFKTINYKIVNGANELYSQYYNRTFGKNTVIPVIEKNIIKRIVKFGMRFE